MSKKKKPSNASFKSPPIDKEELVPDDVIPSQCLPPLSYREMPEPLSWRQMVGPSIILAGLSLGSGEFILWPHLVYKSGFVFFWACILGVITQFFLNMEIERWTLVTGESAITGFCRLTRKWAFIFLFLNIVPHAWPGWATGAGQMISWSIFGAEEVQPVSSVKISGLKNRDELPEGLTFDEMTKQLNWTGKMSEEQRERIALTVPELDSTGLDQLYQSAKSVTPTYTSPYVNFFGIAGLIIVGIILTSGPVVYNTVEKVQMLLVSLIFILVIVIAYLVVKPYAWNALLVGVMSIGQMPPPEAGLSFIALLGALAFAGAGGTTNLGQSNFIKDKGYGMGKYIGRITSPITGQEEATNDVGYHFKHTDKNIARWKEWWMAANIEHFISFFLTCLITLVLLSLISYSLFYDESGNLQAGMESYGGGMNFVWGQAQNLKDQFGSWLMWLFLIMGIAILLTTEFGILDTVARISTDIVKVNYLSENEYWTQSKLYYVFLWGEILLGSLILLSAMWIPNFTQPLFLIRTAAAMNGGVMFLYSVLLLYLNTKVLSRSLAVSPLRFVAMIWSCAFFGYFTIQALQIEVIPLIMDLAQAG